jgi:hypothetical protein
MNPIGPYWNDDSARPRKRNSQPLPDRSAAVKRVEESPAVEKVTNRKPRRQTLWCKCGHGDGAHGMRTNYGPGVNPPNPRFKCLGLTPDGGHLTGGTAGPAGRLSVCRASVGSTPRGSGSRLPAW